MPDPHRVDSSQSARLSFVRLIAYVLPSISLAALGMPIVVALPQFYASKEIGLSLVMTGSVFTFMRIFDVAMDPIAGYISDRWRTRWGRRRPMIALGLPVITLGIWMVFVPGGPVSVLHLCIWLFVMYLGWTMMVIPHLSWGAELTPDYHERSRVYGWSQAATVLGMVTVLIIPAVMEARGNTSISAQVMAMALFALGTLLPAVIWCLYVVPEPEVKLQTHAPLLPTLRFLLKNSAIRRVMTVDLVESISQGARGATFLFFAHYALNLPKAGGTLLLIYFVTGFLCIPLWIALSKRIGKHKALFASYMFTFVTSPLLFFIPSGNFVVAVIILAFYGANYGAPAFLMRAMMADIADADAAENKTERAGVMYSFLSLTSKFGIGASVGVAFAALAWIGFDPKGTNTSEAIFNLRAFFVFLPVVCGIINLAAMWGYPIDQQQQERLRGEIERLRAAHHSADDIMPPGIADGGAALASDSIGVRQVHDLLAEAKGPAE